MVYKVHASRTRGSAVCTNVRALGSITNLIAVIAKMLLHLIYRLGVSKLLYCTWHIA